MSTAILQEIDTINAEIKKYTTQKVKIEQIIQRLQEKKSELKTLYNKKLGDEQAAWETWIDKFPWNEKVQELLVRTFKLEKFRDHQLAAINATLSKKDVVLLMPTGGGKSLCYQLPAVFESGLTLVISPLISLMEDQINKLRYLGIVSYKMTAGEALDVKKAVYDYLNKAIGPIIKLLYISPEMLVKSKKLVSSLQNCHKAKNLNRIAIDEVHCCSEWGHDFRPDYRYLGLLRNLFQGVPIIGLTATATTFVLNDVREMLEIPAATIIKAPFDRPNLCFKVIPKPGKLNAVVESIRELIHKDYPNQSGIIYVCSIKECEDVAKAFKEIGENVCIYHAQLSNEIRLKIYNKWMQNRYRIIIATIAFGLGIDKPDVRFVIHFTLPKTIEDLYQQSGRAGRDGKPSTCIIMYKLGDYLKQSGYAKSKKDVQGGFDVLSYILNLKQCRHSLIGFHFEENNTITCNTMCDNCLRDVEPEICPLSRACKEIYDTIDDASARDTELTLLKLMDLWYKRHNVQITRETGENIVAHLLSKRILKEEKCYTAYNVICYVKKAYDVVPDDGLDVYMVKDAALRRYIHPGVPGSTAVRKRKLKDVCEASTSKVKKNGNV